jgi:transmembrane sensor
MIDEDKRPIDALPLSVQAADWLLRLGEAGDDPVVLRSFEDWRARSPAHRAAWSRALKTWSLLGHIEPTFAAAWRKEEPVAPAPRSRRALHRSRRALATLATLAVAACLILVFGPALRLRLLADHLTATGENRTITLTDGSKVTLGGRSAIAVRLDGERREVTLLTGEAFFDVARDEGRPFVVAADGLTVAVLGTAFDVRLGSETTEVALARGALEARFEAQGRREIRTLLPGDALAVGKGSGSAEMMKVAVEDIGAWRSGRLHVVDATVGSVVDELRRYHSAWIVAASGALSDERVTGVYDLGDPDRALRALIEPWGGSVREAGPLLRVLSGR